VVPNWSCSPIADKKLQLNVVVRRGIHVKLTNRVCMQTQKIIIMPAIQVAISFALGVLALSAGANAQSARGRPKPKPAPPPQDMTTVTMGTRRAQTARLGASWRPYARLIWAIMAGIWALG
jgi:hypothetical protein